MSAVVYIGHIPDGFFEPQIREYFNQFGSVQKIRLSRSKKSGKSKGYGFIQFADEQVAKLAAESMNNYLMFNKLLKCEVMPSEKVHPELFRGCYRYFTRSKNKRINVTKQNRFKDDDALTKQKARLLRGLRKKNKQLKDMGINYSFNPGVHKVKKEIKVEKQDDCFDTSADSGEVSLLLDSSEDEISFKTPPLARKKSRTWDTTPRDAGDDCKAEIKEEIVSDVESLKGQKNKKHKK